MINKDRHFHSEMGEGGCFALTLLLAHTLVIHVHQFLEFLVLSVKLGWNGFFWHPNKMYHLLFQFLFIKLKFHTVALLSCSLLLSCCYDMVLEGHCSVQSSAFHCCVENDTFEPKFGVEIWSGFFFVLFEDEGIIKQGYY